MPRDLLEPRQPRDLLAPAAPAQPTEPPELKTKSTLRKILEGGLGVGEVALSLGTGMVAAPVNSVIAGGVDALSQGIPGERTGHDVMANPPVGTYQPRTDVGQAIIGGIGKVMAPVGRAIESATDVNNPDPAVRATGHFMNAAAGLVPGLAIGRLNNARRIANAPAPTRSAIKSASQQAYAAAERTGEILPQSGLSGFIPKVESMLANEGADKALHPKTFTALNRLYEDATRPGIAGFTPKGAENTRKVLLNAETEAMAGAAPGQVSSDARLAGKLLDEFDDFVERSMPQTTVAAKAARELWVRNLKAGEIEQVLERAKNQAGQYSISGMENALRSQFKTLADNPRRFNRYSKDEQAAILQVVRGGPLQNALKQIGKLAPVGAIAPITSLLAETALPGAGVAMAASGGAARLGAGAIRKSQANRIDDMVRRGSAKPTIRQSLAPASRLEQLGYIPANALALDDENRPRNHLAR